VEDYKPMGTPMITNLKKVTASDSELMGMLSPSLGITREIMSRGPQVLDLEY
jgi:hypothetical protein